MRHLRQKAAGALWLLALSARASDVAPSHGGATEKSDASATAKKKRAVEPPAYGLQESCKLLEALTPKAREQLKKLANEPEGKKWHAVRMVYKPNKERGGDFAVLLGEVHSKPCSQYGIVEKLIDEFEEFAAEELRMHAWEPSNTPDHDAGKPLIYTKAQQKMMWDKHIYPMELRRERAKSKDMCDTSFFTVRKRTMRDEGKASMLGTRVYKIEGADRSRPLNLLKGVMKFVEASADYAVGFDAEEIAALQNGRFDPEKTGCSDVADMLEKRYRGQIKQHGKFMPGAFSTDGRNEQMAQNIGLTFARRLNHVSLGAKNLPLLVLTGCGHTAGIKAHLSVDQGFREIPISALQNCP